MSFPRYERYKESGVEWLGEVPEGWEVKALKKIVATPITDGPHETPSFPDEGIPFVSAEAVSSGRIDFSKIRGFISESDHRRYSQKYRPQVGDIYMVKSGATTGITAIVETDIEFNIWSPLAAIRCGERAVPQFVLNFMRSKNFQEAVTLYWSFGTQQNIGMGVIENLAVALPPLPEQHAIAAFLDRETGKIDALVAEQLRLIELLKEKRQAVISHAVTKGLNPAAPMKDSGIEWLGEVPAGWEVVPLRWSLACSSGDGISSTDIVADAEGENSIPAIGGNGVMGFTYRQNVNHPVLSVGRVGALCGNVHIVFPPAWITDNALVIDDFAKYFNIDYLAHVLKCRNLNEIASKTAQPLITGTQVCDQRVPCPPETEQRAIAAFLNTETAKLDTLTTEAERAIALLKERRTALISAAVTGKIDVRKQV